MRSPPENPELEPETQTSTPYRNQSSTQKTEPPELVAPNLKPRNRGKPQPVAQPKTTRPTACLQNPKIGANPILNLNQAMVKKKATSRGNAWGILRNRLCLNEGAADGDLRPEWLECGR
jgi:hypothetical protein